MGVIVCRGRMMTDDFQLTDRARTWINAIHRNYASELVEDKREIAIAHDLAGSLTK